MSDAGRTEVDATLDERDAEAAAMGYEHARLTTLPAGMPRDRETLATRQAASPAAMLAESGGDVLFVAPVRLRGRTEARALEIALAKARKGASHGE